MTASAQASPAPPVTFIGRPLAHWMFGLRTWLAMVLALYVAFWVQLDGASSAATTAAILALPTRGQAFSKALHRVAGTIVGVAASLLIAGLFNDTRTLFIVAVAAWLGLCVFAANMLDGNRAYAAVLSGYTVAIVAVADIDDPTSTFSSGINRGAAILIGIASVAVVSDLFGAPDLLPGLAKRIEAAHAEVRAFALRSLERGSADAAEVARLLGRLTALRADTLLLPAESVSGRARAGAARRGVAELVRAARAARILGATLHAMGEYGPAWRDRMAAAFLDDGAADRLLARAGRIIADEGPDPARLVAARGVEAVVNRDRAVDESLRDLRTGRGSARGPRLPLYHSRANAARNAARTALAVLAAGVLLVLVGLPSSSTVLLFVCVLVCLSANSPDPWKFTVGAVMALPLAAVAAGVTEFLVLDGADAYPLLAIALLPTVLVAGLLMTAGVPALSGVGFLLAVFTPALMSLANPQSYNPFNFLNEATFVVTASLLLAAAVATLLPTDDARRRGWMLRDIRRELRAAADGRRMGRRSLDEASFRSADRIGQIAALSYRDGAARDATLAHALHLSEVTFAARWLGDALAGLDASAARDARSALAALDPTRLRAAADRLGAGRGGGWAAAGALRLAALMDRYAADLALARAGVAP